jgi:PTS system nitrogen regulatory IIA component
MIADDAAAPPFPAPSSDGFGRMMRDARRKRGIGVRELARRLRVSDAYISRLELGRSSPPAPQRAVAIAAELGLDVDRFLAAAGHVAPDVKTILLARPEVAQLVRDLAAAPYSRQQLQYLLQWGSLVVGAATRQ